MNSKLPQKKQASTQYFEANNLSINPNKTHYILFHETMQVGKRIKNPNLGKQLM
jgi:hypothetical protein